MSGITPLLDTLLHQVLGKRVDIPRPQDVNQPVKPTSPADALRALHSDSRLDPRTNATSPQGTTRSSTHVTEGSTTPPRQDGASPASSQTHLSSAGRTIADLLMRFPAAPSTLATKTPLVPAGQAPDPTQLATRLEGSVRDSGLFYESHLNRWYKGELTRQQLEREPQMWRALRFSPALPLGASNVQQPHLLLPADARPLHPSGTQQAPQAASATPPAATPPSSTHQLSSPGSSTATTLASSTPPPADSNPLSRGVGSEASTSQQSSPPLPSPLHESLQGIVRHQLEMLVTPTLRWEGDVWSGLFMALLIQPPAGQQESREGTQDTAADEDSQRTWRSDIDLDIQGAGRIKASVWMQAMRLEVDMRIADSDTLARLQDGLTPLKARLSGHGFEEVGITLKRLTAEAADAGS